jgi:hypothetical protein
LTALIPHKRDERDEKKINGLVKRYLVWVKNQEESEDSSKEGARAEKARSTVSQWIIRTDSTIPAQLLVF